MPVMTRRKRSSAPTADQRIASLVAAHETRKAVGRSSAPPPVIRTAAPVPAPTAPLPPPPPVVEESRGGGVMSWLRGALFGSYELAEWGFGETKNSTNVLIPIVVVLGLLYFFKMGK
jgi:hypothetical protein